MAKTYDFGKFMKGYGYGNGVSSNSAGITFADYQNLDTTGPSFGANSDGLNNYFGAKTGPDSFSSFGSYGEGNGNLAPNSPNEGYNPPFKTSDASAGGDGFWGNMSGFEATAGVIGGIGQIGKLVLMNQMMQEGKAQREKDNKFRRLNYNNSVSAYNTNQTRKNASYAALSGGKATPGELLPTA